MKRRDFLKLMGLASGAATLSACGADKQAEKLIPYLVPPEDGTIPGVASYRASTCTECPANCGLQVKIREELPVKLEGLPGHPINDGTLCMRGQASLTRLYHAGRLREPLRRTSGGDFRPVSWEDAYAEIAGTLKRSQQLGLQNLYLSGQTSGTLSELIDQFCETLQVERLPEYEPYAHAAIRRANEALFGQKAVPLYRIERTDFLLTLGADLLETFVSPVGYATQIAEGKAEHRLHWTHIEPHVSLTGVNAQERLLLDAGSEVDLLSWLFHALNAHAHEEVPGSIIQVVPHVSLEEAATATGIDGETLEALLYHLEDASEPLLIAGGVSTAHKAGLQVALLAGLVQWVTEMVGTTVDFSTPEAGEHLGDLTDLVSLTKRLQANQVGVIFLSRTDPIRTAPGDVGISGALGRAQFRVGFADLLTPTMEQCDILLPLSLTLESWYDAEPRKGLHNLSKPAMELILNTRSEGDILIQLVTSSTATTLAEDHHSFQMAHLTEQLGEAEVASLLEKGYYQQQIDSRRVQLNAETALPLLRRGQGDKEMGRWGGPNPQPATRQPVTRNSLLVAVPSIRTYDGRSAQLPLLNEIPDPLTTISYGAWVSVSETAAQRQGWQEKDELTLGSKAFAVKIQPGLPAQVFTVQRDMLDPTLLRMDPVSGETICYLEQPKFRKTGAVVALPILSGSSSQSGRGLIPMGHDHEHEERHEGVRRMYPKHEHQQYQWTMAIDLDACTGCSACVAACYIENNVAVVGAEEHLKGREMSWIRIEPYYEEDEAEFLPMMCQQCEDAPCEPVCPVYATFHNEDGLNAQVYNRCVGTRYCSNNCPYKVRRFNWFQHERPILANEIRMENPDVSVRDKGIMEKCTFCVQRIRNARDKAKDESRLIQDGEVAPACAQSCPSHAIVFGNILDENACVYQPARSERSYRVFEHLGTEPSVYYLKKQSKGHEA